MVSVSVIMSAYKEPTDIFIKAVNSIREQTYRDFEFLIVLDCPSNTELRGTIEQLRIEDSRIIPIWNDNNIGLAESLNRALDLARGDYICRMDADDVALPNRIESQIGFLRDKGLDLIGCYLEVINQDGESLYPVDSIPVSDGGIRKALRWNNCIPHPSWFGKREVFFRKYRAIPLCEDYDFLLRAALDGVRMGNCPEVLVKYRMSEESLSRSNLYRQFLYQRYLTTCYSYGNPAAVSDAAKWVENHYDEGRSEAYLHANALFNRGLSLVRQRKLFNALKNLVQVPFVSWDYMKKVLRLIKSVG